MISPTKLFDISFRILLGILPFLTIISVVTSQKLGIPGISFLKEGLLFLMLVALGMAIYKKQIRFRWTIYDTLMAVYILVLVGITLGTTGWKGLVFGGRYDFSFLGAFFIIFHGYPLLQEKVSYYIRLFLWTGGIAILLGFLLKWPLQEEILLFLGYSGNPSNWQFGGAIPIFHGVDGAQVRRLQGIFDGPNTMGAYLLIYMGFLLYFFRMKKEWFFMLGFAMIFLIGGIYYTYSRSALLGLIGGVIFVILLSLRPIFKKYARQFFILLGIAGLGILCLVMFYSWKFHDIYARAGSTKGHAERMLVGYERFVEHPFGQGLGSAGPAYRYVLDLENTDKKEVDELDRFYIPESWYIQQFIEGGFVGGVLFLVILSVLFLHMVSVSTLFALPLVGIGVMNLFLHTFESSLISLTLFLLIGLILAYRFQKKSTAHHPLSSHD